MKRERSPDKVIGRPARRAHVPAEFNDITHRVIGCAMEVHSVLGPGLLERSYEEALAYELRRADVAFQRQCEIRVFYKEIALPVQRMDMVVENTLIVEIKAVEEVSRNHLAQLVSYLRAARLPLGLLINFNTPQLKDGIYRRLNERSLPTRL